jgi:hypothetical protein
VARRPLAGFLVIVLGLSWLLLSIPVLAFHGVIPGANLAVEIFAMAATLLILLPTALWVTWVTDGRAGVRALFWPVIALLLGLIFGGSVQTADLWLVLIKQLGSIVLAVMACIRSSMPATTTRVAGAAMPSRTLCGSARRDGTAGIGGPRLFGVAMIKSATLPRWSGILIAVGAPAHLLGFGIAQLVSTAAWPIAILGSVSLGAGLAWPGYRLWHIPAERWDDGHSEFLALVEALIPRNGGVKSAPRKYPPEVRPTAPGVWVTGCPEVYA